MFKRDLELERTWASLLDNLESVIGKKPKDLNAVLFLIGVQELGRGNRPFSKEEKQDLMHIGICKVLKPFRLLRIRRPGRGGMASLESA